MPGLWKLLSIYTDMTRRRRQLARQGTLSQTIFGLRTCMPTRRSRGATLRRPLNVGRRFGQNGRRKHSWWPAKCAPCPPRPLCGGGDCLASADDPQSWGEAAELAGQAGAWAFAAAWWEKFRVTRPNDDTGYSHGALALLRSGNHEAAHRLIELASKRWPSSPLIARVQAELGREETAGIAFGVTPTPAQPATGDTLPVAPVAKTPGQQRSRGFLGWLGL